MSILVEGQAVEAAAGAVVSDVLQQALSGKKYKSLVAARAVCPDEQGGPRLNTAKRSRAVRIRRPLSYPPTLRLRSQPVGCRAAGSGRARGFSDGTGNLPSEKPFTD